MTAEPPSLFDALRLEPWQVVALWESVRDSGVCSFCRGTSSDGHELDCSLCLAYEKVAAARVAPSAWWHPCLDEIARDQEVKGV